MFSPSVHMAHRRAYLFIFFFILLLIIRLVSLKCIRCFFACVLLTRNHSLFGFENCVMRKSTFAAAKLLQWQTFEMLNARGTSDDAMWESRPMDKRFSYSLLRMFRMLRKYYLVISQYFLIKHSPNGRDFGHFNASFNYDLIKKHSKTIAITHLIAWWVPHSNTVIKCSSISHSISLNDPVCKTFHLQWDSVWIFGGQ